MAFTNEFPAVVTRRFAAGRWRPRRRTAGSAKTRGGRRVERPGPAEPIEQAITASGVRAALARLSPEYRAIITVMHWNQHTAAETAKILGISVAAVNFRSYYAVHALRAALREPSPGAPADPA